MINLGVNIDHIATLRNARGDFFPSILHFASIVESSGRDFITIHLREDRRHIKDHDLTLLRENITTSLNLEMACNNDVLGKALSACPHKVTLVPERREEVTTEGGLDLKNNLSRIKDFTSALKGKGIIVSLFIEADEDLIEKTLDIGADEVEIHTGSYSLKTDERERTAILKKIGDFTDIAVKSGIKVCAGHGLNYHNVGRICGISGISELNIGYSIIARSLEVGLSSAVSEMRANIDKYELLNCVVKK